MNGKLKKNSLIASKMFDSIQVGIDKKFVSDVNKINGSVQTYVNNRLRVMLSEVNGLETLYTTSGLRPYFVKTKWKPLNTRYTKRKGNQLHFYKTGHLKRYFPRGLNSNKGLLIRTFGGYQAKTAKVTNIQRGRWGKSGIKKAYWQFEIFNEVYKKRDRAEILLDKFIPEEKRKVKHKKGLKTIGIPSKVKFGLNMQGKPTRNYTRKFLFDYIVSLELRLYLEIKEKFPVNIKGK